MTWFLLAAYSETQEKRHTLREKLISKKETGFADLGHSQSIHIAKDAKIGKACFGEEDSLKQDNARKMEGIMKLSSVTEKALRLEAVSKDLNLDRTLKNIFP